MLRQTHPLGRLYSYGEVVSGFGRHVTWRCPSATERTFTHIHSTLGVGMTNIYSTILIYTPHPLMDV